MITPIRVAFLAGPNASAQLRLRRGTVLRIMLANGFEHTLDVGIRHFIMGGKSLSPNGELAIFPVEVWEMDESQTILLDCLWKTGEKVCEMAWEAVTGGFPDALPDELATGFKAAIVEILTKTRLPGEYGPDRYERNAYGASAVMDRFIRGKLFKQRSLQPT